MIVERLTAPRVPHPTSPCGSCAVDRGHHRHEMLPESDPRYVVSYGPDDVFPHFVTDLVELQEMTREEARDLALEKLGA